jgi:hypothetical protein
MSASLVKAQTRSGDQIPDGSRDQHLSGLGERRDARGDMDRDALHFVFADFDLACVEAGSDLNAERANRLGDPLSATNRARRAVESGEKAVTERLHLIAS